MKKITIMLILITLFFVTCYEEKGINVGASNPLISHQFRDQDTFVIVCKGYPKEELSGAGRQESAKRSAILNVYFFIKNIFDDSVAPDKDGRIEKFEMLQDYGVIYYIVQKKGLKKRVKKEAMDYIK